MPASRSRTDRWRTSLEQITARGGGIELSVAPDAGSTDADLLWRVRVYQLRPDRMIVEGPAVAGSPIEMRVGTRVVGVMSVGQNRWMFESRVLGHLPWRGPRGRDEVALELALPERVERCSRRSANRTSTAEIHLPVAEVFPLLDPASVVAAEVANQAQIRDAGTVGGSAEAVMLPEVGPSFQAQLMNISGGGVGLVVTREDMAAAEELKLYWLRLDMRPHIAAPLGVTGKIVHKHIDSAMNLYCGVSFEFGFHAAHRSFVVEQVSRAAASIQQRQRDGAVRRAA